MIVNSYNITFSDGKAPALTCKYSEVNREYILKPDVELNSNTYSAELVIVKPDMTFTINGATIDNDGNIIITIPSQATVVKGVAQYLVRIYNNNTDVYSAYGEMWVDDNLLTDDVIESVAEVNGYNFPDDFALKTDIPEIDDTETVSDKTWSSEKISNEIASVTPSADTFIDDDDVLYDKTWSSEKISYELGNVPGFHVYTTTEQASGRWVNGKTLYEKTFTVTNPSAITVSGCYAYKIAEITDVETAMFDIGVVTDDLEHRNYSLPYNRYYSNSDKIIPEVYVDMQTHTMICYVTCPQTGGFTMSKVELTILYTKFLS